MVVTLREGMFCIELLLKDISDLACKSLAHYQQRPRKGYNRQDEGICTRGPCPKKGCREYQESNIGKIRA